MDMRTTVDTPDPIYRRSKSRAVSEGGSAKELILRGVDHVLKRTVATEHAQHDLPSYIWRDRRVVEVPSDELRAQAARFQAEST